MSDESANTAAADSDEPRENRLRQLVEAGVAPTIGDFSPNARKVIQAMTDTEFQSVLSIRKTILRVAGEDELRQSDECMSLIW